MASRKTLGGPIYKKMYSTERVEGHSELSSDSSDQTIYTSTLKQNY